MPSHSHNKVQKTSPYTVYSSQLHTGICIFSNISWCRHLFRPIMGYAHKSQTTHLPFLGETSRFTPNRLNLLPTKFLLVLSYSTAPQFGVHSQIQISVNLKLSNVEMPDGSNTTMDRLPVSHI